MNRRRASRRDLAIVLGSGFRGHTVVVMLDGREVYRQVDVTTSVTTTHADAFVATARGSRVRVMARVTPGDLVVSAECDLRASARVVISLMGKGSLWLETDGAWPASRPEPDRRVEQLLPLVSR
jgi:hypothetical protein